MKKKIELPTEAQNNFDIPGVDIRFYTKQYTITNDDKKMLVSLVQRPEFRVFEKYMDWRVNASAHRMKALLLEGKDEQARAESAAIDSLARITKDMRNFWTEVKAMETVEGIGIGKKEDAKSLKPFGKDKYPITTNEATGI